MDRLTAKRVEFIKKNFSYSKTILSPRKFRYGMFMFADPPGTTFYNYRSGGFCVYYEDGEWRGYLERGKQKLEGVQSENEAVLLMIAFNEQRLIRLLDKGIEEQGKRFAQDHHLEFTY